MTVLASSAKGPRIRTPRSFWLFVTAVLASSAFALHAADGAPSGEPRVSITPRLAPGAIRSSGTLRLDVNLTLIPVSVTDPLDHPLMGLKKEDFRLFEENTEQEILSFSSEEGPVSLGIVFDKSGSMRNRIDKSIAAVHQFLETTLPGDEFLLVSFSDVPKLITGFTTRIEDIDRELSFVEPQGWTALRDAMYLAVQHTRKSKNSRRALLVLTDGGDNNSRYTETEVRNLVVESDVRVYVIGISERPKFLQRIADETGGRAFWVRKVDELPDAIDRLSTEFRSHYLLGYRSTNLENDGKYRKVKVQVNPRPDIAEQMRVFWRRGYYTPGE
jgi:Ca-activated chloride channel family protein